jgi:hypothetical protein
MYQEAVVGEELQQRVLELHYGFILMLMMEKHGRVLTLHIRGRRGGGVIADGLSIQLGNYPPAGTIEIEGYLPEQWRTYAIILPRGWDCV